MSGKSTRINKKMAKKTMNKTMSKNLPKVFNIFLDEVVYHWKFWKRFNFAFQILIKSAKTYKVNDEEMETITEKLSDKNVRVD